MEITPELFPDEVVAKAAANFVKFHWSFVIWVKIALHLLHADLIQVYAVQLFETRTNEWMNV